MTLPCLNRIYTDPASAARRSRAEVPLLLHEAYTRERRSPCLQTKSRSIPTYRLPKPQSNQQQQSAFDSRHTSRADCMSADPGKPCLQAAARGHQRHVSNERLTAARERFEVKRSAVPVSRAEWIPPSAKAMWYTNWHRRRFEPRGIAQLEGRPRGMSPGGRVSSSGNAMGSLELGRRFR